ncbi:hypothetical protein HQR03_08565 [Psychrobacter okhotskensis]|uniref:hypothetical protein n=1 Tax=Psychrobacter okhotskensis TaxID=212403 RepID=UPI0015652D23|nr:hypothetical protein [Psychrobacter okhotskensis]NRD70586.1 hypothetical protein [Psychrobacter okhotskensis]
MHKAIIFSLYIAVIPFSNLAFAAPVAEDKVSVQSLVALENRIEQQDEQIRLLSQRVDQHDQERKQSKANLEEYITQYQAIQKASEQQLDTLTEQQTSLESSIGQTNQSLSVLTQDTTAADTDIKNQIQALSTDTQKKNDELFQQLSNRTLATLAGLLILLGLLAAAFYLLRKRQQESNTTLNNKVQSALTNVQQAEENIVQSDMELSTQLLAILEQIKLERQALADSNLAHLNTENNVSNNVEMDHTLALKLADEIHRMRKRLQALPNDTKGIKSLSKSLERLEAELEDQGYELIDYLGSNYTDNMSIQARFVPSDEVNVDESIITKVVYPQVNYDGKMIRMADVEVSVG